MTTDIVLKNGRIIDPLQDIDLESGSLVIRSGRIEAIVTNGELPEDLEQIDLSGKWIVPGLIDMHVHLREPGEEYKETIDSGTRAAAAGGFTAVACMPNTKPVLDNAQTIAFVVERAKNASARVYPIGAVSKGSAGETLAEIGEMHKAGCVAVTDDGLPVMNSQLMRRALEYTRNFNIPVISHSEDIALSRGGAMNEGALSTRLGLKGIPRIAEESMVYRDIALAGYTGGKVHIAHISTRESVELVRRAKERGIKVTAETAPHYFSLNEDAVIGYNTYAKMNPPLRTEDDVEAIKAGLQDGTIDAIASDHAPHSDLEKQLEFAQAANGIIGLQTTLPLTLALVRSGIIDVRQMVLLLSANPARILHAEGGSIRPGQSADVTVIDPEADYIFSREFIVSKSKNSPFLDSKFRGKAVMTMVSGQISHRDI